MGSLEEEIKQNSCECEDEEHFVKMAAYIGEECMNIMSY